MTFQLSTNELTTSDHLPLIKKSSLPSGSGKSRSIFNNVIASGRPTIITTPTYKLSCQYEQHFLNKGIVPVVISSERHTDRPAHQHLIDACESKNRIILVNRDVFHNANADTSAYDIYQDEFSDIIDIIPFDNAQIIHPILTKLLHCVRLSKSTRYYEVDFTDYAKAIAKHGWNQAVIKSDPDFLKLCKRIESQHYLVYILAENYNKYRDGKISSIQFWTLMLPSILGDSPVTMVGANGEDQFVSKLWSNLVNFEDATNITGDYTDFSHKAPTADLKRGGRIIYMSQKTVTGEVLKAVKHQTAIDAVQSMIADKFGETALIYGFNNNPVKYGKPSNWTLPHSKKVRLVPHGQNDFQDVHMAVCLGTQYYDPATYVFLLEVFDLTSDEVNRGFGLERLYQFVMRTSARNQHCDEPFIAIVWDLKSAEFLQEKFPFASVEYIDIGIEAFRDPDAPKSTPKTANQRQAKRRDKKKTMQNDHANTQQYEGFKMIVWTDKYAQQLATAAGSWFDFGEYLANDHFHYKPKSKDKAKCFREGDLTDLNNHRMVSNIKSTKTAILDIDIVKRDPQDLSDFLYECGWSHFIFNSHGSTPLEPRIRVVIGLSESVNQKNLVHILFLLRADIDARFGEGVYLIDKKTLTINWKFHSPSVSEYKAPLFIKRHVMKDMKFEAQFLDVKWFLTRNPVVVKKDKAPSPVRPSASRRGDEKQAIEAVLDRWSVVAGRGLGSTNFHQSAIELKKLGLRREDCIQILTENRHRFGHGQDRDAVYTVGRVFEGRR